MTTDLWLSTVDFAIVDIKHYRNEIGIILEETLLISQKYYVYDGS